MLGSMDRNHPYSFWAFWVSVRDRDTGAVQPGGIWTGSHDRIFSVNGQNRMYLAGGQIVGLDRLSYVAGAQNIQSQKVELVAVTLQVETLIRSFEARQAGFEIHRVRPLNPNALSGDWVVEQGFKGNIDDISFPRSAAGTDGSTQLRCSVTLMSASRMGTRTLPLIKSDAAQRLVDANDAGRKYSSSKAKVTWMGETKNPHRIPDGNRVIGYQG